MVQSGVEQDLAGTRRLKGHLLAQQLEDGVHGMNRG
jgi:hypothetical protein